MMVGVAYAKARIDPYGCPKDFRRCGFAFMSASGHFQTLDWIVFVGYLL